MNSFYIEYRISNIEFRMSKLTLRHSAVPCSIFDIQSLKIVKLILMKAEDSKPDK
jgi:hypothetical protein